MRFRTLTATATSVAWRASVRDRCASPIIGRTTAWHVLQRWISCRLRYARADLFLGPLRSTARQSLGDGVYFSFVTGLTIGYGDLVPRRALSRFLAILIGILGTLLTALLAAIAVRALQTAAER